MLKQIICNEGLTFTSNVDGNNMPFEDWWQTNDCIYFFPLETLVNNGHATANEYECFVPFESIYLMEDDDRILLNIPDVYNKGMRIRGEGIMNASGFKYCFELLTHVPDGKLLTYERQGNIVTIENNKYLLNEKQYELILFIEDFNQTDESLKNHRLQSTNLCKNKGTGH